MNMNRCQETIGVDRLNPLKECELGVKNIAKRLERKDRDRAEVEGERRSRILEGKQKDKETDKDWICNSCKVEKHKLTECDRCNTWLCDKCRDIGRV